MAQRVAQKQIFFFQSALLDSVAHEDDDLVERKRLFDEIESAKFGGAHGRLDGAVAGDHDDRGRVGKRLNAAKGFEAVDSRKPDV